VVVPEFFTKEDLEPVRQCIDNIVDDLAQKLYNAGKIKSNVYSRSAYICNYFQR